MLFIAAWGHEASEMPPVMLQKYIMSANYDVMQGESIVLLFCRSGPHRHIVLLSGTPCHVCRLLEKYILTLTLKDPVNSIAHSLEFS